MTNGEIRAKAKKKRSRQKGLVPIAFVQVGLTVAMTFAGRWTQTLDLWVGVSLYALLFTVNTLISSAGCVYASCAAWRTGRARFTDLFAPVTDARCFARIMAPVLIVVALTLVQRYAAGFFPEDWSAAASAWRIGSLVFTAAAALAYTLFYAIALWPDAGLSEVFGRGFRLALEAFWRFVGMTLTILFLPLMGITILGAELTAVAQSDAPNLVALIALGAAFAGCAAFVAWRVMPYYDLAGAGLAEEVFCAPERSAQGHKNAL